MLWFEIALCYFRIVYCFILYMYFVKSFFYEDVKNLMSLQVLCVPISSHMDSFLFSCLQYEIINKLNNVVLKFLTLSIICPCNF